MKSHTKPDIFATKSDEEWTIILAILDHVRMNPGTSYYDDVNYAAENLLKYHGMRPYPDCIVAQLSFLLGEDYLLDSSKYNKDGTPLPQRTESNPSNVRTVALGAAPRIFVSDKGRAALDVLQKVISRDKARDESTYQQEGNKEIGPFLRAAIAFGPFVVILAHFGPVLACIASGIFFVSYQLKEIVNLKMPTFTISGTIGAVLLILGFIELVFKMA